MRLLDLFAGAGGAAVGYNRAGFTEIVGVDTMPQPRYPFPFLVRDAIETMEWLLAGNAIREGRLGKQLWLQDFDAIHASPPCQRFTCLNSIHHDPEKHPDLVDDCRDALQKSGRLWVIENVPGSPLIERINVQPSSSSASSV